MAEERARVVAESVFDRNRRRETEINEALKQEAARHAVEAHRLRALRLERDQKAKRN